MTVFALIHGAWHGAWCWDEVERELARLGHRSVAVDLPCDDPTAGLSQYADVVVDALAGVGGDVILVGHSLGGLTIPLVAERRPVRELVFLCAILPAPGLSFLDQLEREDDVFVSGFGREIARDELGRSYWPTEDAALSGLYPECEPTVARAAACRLRPQARVPITEAALERWPDVEMRSIYGRRDAAVNPAWSRRTAAERLGVEAIELDSGHSPFLTQPAELAALLASS